MTTIAELIDGLLNEILIGSYRAHYNKLNGALTDSAGDATLAYAFGGLGDASVLEIGSEQMFVVPGGVNEGAKTLSLIRGFKGTTAVAHSDGATVAINPRYPRSAIFQAMVKECLSWPDSIYMTTSVEASISATSSTIDLQDLSGLNNIRQVLGVWRQGSSSDTGRWVKMTGWRFERDIIDEGSAHLFLSGCAPVGDTVRVLVSSPFTPPSAETNIVSGLGMPEQMGEILQYGAAWRLVNGREARRLLTEVEAQGRNAEEIPVQANSTFARQLKQLRDARIGDEVNRLRYIHGVRVS